MFKHRDGKDGKEKIRDSSQVGGESRIFDGVRYRFIWCFVFLSKDGKVELLSVQQCIIIVLDDGFVLILSRFV